MSFRSFSFAAAAGMLMSVGCASTPSMQIKSWEMGDVDVGGANQIVIADAEGRRSAREFVSIEMGKAARSMGYFQVKDMSGDGVKLEITGRKGEVLNFEGEKVNRVFVRADVLEWDADKETNTSTVTKGRGKRAKTETVTTTTINANVLLAISVLDENGRALLAEKEYVGESALADGGDKNEAIEQAAVNAINAFLADVTPQVRTSTVQFDGSDEKQASFLKTAAEGNPGQAEKDLQSYIDSSGETKAALINLAIVQDALGNHAAALKNYDKALQAGAGPRIEDLRAACARRLRAAEALGDEGAKVSSR